VRHDSAPRPAEAAVLEARRRLERRRQPSALRAVQAPRLRVADVALFYGERTTTRTV